MSLQGKILSDTAALDNDIVQASFTILGTSGVPVIESGPYDLYELGTPTSGVYVVLRSGSPYASTTDAIETVLGLVPNAYSASTDTMLAFTGSSDNADHAILGGPLPDPNLLLAQSIGVDGIFIMVGTFDGAIEAPADGERIHCNVYYKASGLRS